MLSTTETAAVTVLWPGQNYTAAAVVGLLSQ